MNEIYLYGPIGKGFDYFTGEPAISGADMRDSLAQFKGKDVTVRVNSDGGDVFEGKAIMEAIRRHEGHVRAEIDAIAASAASYAIATADEVLMTPGSMMMIHAPWTIAMGNEFELAEVIDQLRAVREGMVEDAYIRRGVKASEVREMMQGETWLKAEEAVEKRFADGMVVDDREKVAALIRPDIFSSIPKEVWSMGRDSQPAPEGFVYEKRELLKPVDRQAVNVMRLKLRHAAEARERRMRSLTTPPK